MSVGLNALNAVAAMVGIHNHEHLVEGHGIVVFVPHHDNGVVALVPDLGILNGRYDPLYRDIAEQDICFIQTGLRAVVVCIKVAERAGIAASMLVIALIWRNE